METERTHEQHIRIRGSILTTRLYGHLHWFHSLDPRPRGGPERLSFHDRGLRGFWNGLDHVARNRAHDGRPCVGSNRHGHDGVEKEFVLDEEIAHDDHLDHDHDPNQSARMQREEYEPTIG